MIHGDSIHLFHSGGRLFEFLRSTEEAASREIGGLGADYILNVSEEDLTDSLVSKHSLQFPHILRDQIDVADHGETSIDVRHEPGRDIRDRSEPHYVKGTSVTIAVPFKGDERIFSYEPSTRVQIKPKGRIYDNQILLTYEQVHHDAAALKQKYESDLSLIDMYLEFASDEVKSFNVGLREKIRAMVSRRRQWLLSSLNMVNSLGIPLRERNDMPRTYTVPDIRRRPEVLLPKASKGPYRPEPTLSSDDYQHILKVIDNMFLVMEKSPTAFVSMKEEDLRHHFLVQLNGHFEGRATGETFNYGGKTDVIISHEGRNIFIAECKYWRGERSLTAAIDQLLAYASWRDTKTAILLFSKQKDFGSVINKIDPIVKQHPHFKRALDSPDETSFQYIFGHKDDVNRELLLTVKAFNIPAPANGQDGT